jgi:hypothetical protein
MSEKKLTEEPSQVAQVEHAKDKRTLSVTDATTPRIASGVNIIENPLTVRIMHNNCHISKQVKKKADNDLS